MRVLNSKIGRFREKNQELQRAIDLRVEQFSRTENYIAEEIHFEHYEELKKQKETISKYEPIYKRNYLMKLRELENIVHSLAKQDRIITETETSIVSVRTEIDLINQLVGTQRKRYQSSLQAKKQEKLSTTQHPLEPAEQSPADLPPQPTNDKNMEED